MTPADIAALRALLARAKAARWKRVPKTRNMPLYAYPVRRWVGAPHGSITLWDNQVSITTPKSYHLLRSSHSLADVIAALEATGALPPVDRTELIRRAIADPGQFCPRRRWPDATGIGAWESIPAWGARAVVIALAGGA